MNALATAAIALSLMGCAPATDLSLDIRLPADHSSLQAIRQVNMTVTRQGVVLAQRTFSSSARRLSLSGVSYGADTVVALVGLNAAGDVLASGRTCPVDFAANGSAAPLYFAPTSYFLPTLGAPAKLRIQPIVAAVDDGVVLVAGGADAAGASLFADSELFTPGLAAFSAGAGTLNTQRQQAQAIAIPGVGVLVVGGLDGTGTPIAGAELYSKAAQEFVPLADTKIDARVGHRAVLLPSGRVFVSGGRSTKDGSPVASTFLIYVLSDGSFQVTAGPPLSAPRREHATVVASGIPVVFGGYGADGLVLDSIEELDPALATAAAPVAALTYARAEATATQLSSGSTAGSILVVGGRGTDGTARADAELFNPITRTTTVLALSVGRFGHTATLLQDGRVLVVGGFDSSGSPLRSVELFEPDVGFLTERPLNEARGNHAAVTMCDQAILFVGGAATAELYTAPAT
jgi:galactose oxidase-like protein